ncbi:MAG: AAA-like domain-containing protein [Deltaproteobacteria bacterium]|jgi:hypothetical protein|nr:AAA-like domain-containing protein [Deltaproteobacteria bacterium]
MTTEKIKQFNTAGPCDPDYHYMIPAVSRLPDVEKLIDRREYFVLHSPRQTGKTTFMMAKADRLNMEGSYYAMYRSLEELRGIVDEAAAMKKIIDNLREAVDISNSLPLKSALGDNFNEELNRRSGFASHPLKIWLRVLCDKLEKDLVLFFDEIDALEGDTLSPILSQLRDGYEKRSKSRFPRSIALIGMRNIRYFEIKKRDESKSQGSSNSFDIITEFLTLPDFTPIEVASIYTRHTQASGQVFEKKAIQRAWDWTEGQPWLINALARQAVEKIAKKRLRGCHHLRHHGSGRLQPNKKKGHPYSSPSSASIRSRR